MDDINNNVVTSVTCTDKEATIRFNDGNEKKFFYDSNSKSINYGEYTKEKNLAISKVDFNCNGSDIDNTYATIKLSMTTDYSNEDFGLNLIIPIRKN